jgi:hypothetical protein
MALETGTEIDELYYLVSARVQGLDNAKAELTKFANFLEGHPLAVAGALGTALLAVGTEAVKMAAQFTDAVQQIGSSIPNFGNGVGALGDQLKAIADTSGVAMTDLIATARTLAATGVTSSDDLAQRLQALTKVSVVTGEGMDGLAAALGNVGREFQLSGPQFDAMVARLTELSTGHSSVTELAEAISFAAPSVLKLGLSFETTSAAVAELTAAGLKARQAGADIAQLAAQGQDGADVIAAIGAKAGSTTDALQKLDDAFQKAQSSPEQMAKTMKEQFNTALLDLGQNIMPIVTPAMQGFAEVLGGVNYLLTAGASSASEYTAALGHLTIPSGAKQLQDFIARETKDLASLQQQADALQKHINSPGEILKELAVPGIGLGPAEQMKELQAEIAQVSQGIGVAQAKLAALGSAGTTAVSPLVAQFVTLAQKVQDANGDGDKLNALLSTIKIPDLKTAITNAGLTGNQTAVSQLSTLLVTVKAHLGDIATAARESQQKVADAFHSLQDMAAETSATLQGALLGAWQKLNDQIDRTVRQAVVAADTTHELGPALVAAQTALGNATTPDEMAKAAAQVDAIWSKLIAKSPQLAQVLDAAAQNQAAFWKKAAADFNTGEAQFEQTFQKEMQSTADELRKTQDAVTALMATLHGTALGPTAQDIFGLSNASLQDKLDLLKQLQGVTADFASQAAAIANNSQLDIPGKIAALGALASFSQTVTANLDAGWDATLKGLGAIGETQLQTIQRQRDFTDAVLEGAAAFSDMLGSAGLISDSIATAISTVSKLAEGVGKVTDEIAKMNVKVVDASGHLVSAATSGDVIAAVTGAIGSLGPLLSEFFGTSPEQKQQQEAQASANATLVTALDNLKNALNSFADITISGKSFGNLSANLPDIIKTVSAGIPGAGGRSRPEAPSEAEQEQFLINAFEQGGTSLADFIAEAKSVGITLSSNTTPTVQDLNNVLTEIKKQQFAEFANNFSDQLAKLNAQFTIFDSTGPEKFKGLVDLLNDPTVGAPAIFNSLKGIDVSTVDGAAQATKILQGIFTSMSTIPSTDFGGLDPTQFLDAIETLIGDIPQAAAGADAFSTALQNLTDGFQVFGTDAIGQAQGYLNTLKQFSPQLATLLAPFDLTTQSGIQGASDAMKGFFTDVTDGKVTFDDSTVSWNDVLTAIGYTNGALQEFGDNIGNVASAADTAAENAALNVRNLRAAGDTAGADAAQRAIDEGTEITDGLAKGFSNATIAQIELTQANEDNATAAQAYIQAQNDAADAAAQAAQAAQQLAAAQTQAANAQADAAVQQLKDQFQLFGITDPVAQAQEMVGVLTKVAPIFQQILGTADISTAPGRADALASLQTFFLNNPSGVASGLANASQVQSSVLDLAQLLQGAGVSTTTSGTNSSFAIDQSITTADADRIGGLLTAMLTVDNDQLDVLRSIATALGASFATVDVPQLPTATTPSAGAGTTIIQLTLNGLTLDPTSALSPATQQSIRQLGWQITQEIARTQGGAS